MLRRLGTSAARRALVVRLASPPVAAARRRLLRASSSTSGAAGATSNVVAPSLAAGTWPEFMSKKAITVDNPDDFNRWLMPVSMASVHMSIGSVYAFSMWSSPLTRQLGVVASSAQDWALGDVLTVFSCTAVSLGVTTFVLGPWQERAGPRMVAAVAGTAYASAFGLTALGAEMHSLPVMCAGYGALGGIGWGLGYLSPVSTLMRWFPERKGLAAGLALTSFGLGSALGAPLIGHLIDKAFVAPTYLGPAADVVTKTAQGVLYAADGGGGWAEAVVATAADLAKVPGTLDPGVYLVGTGDSGVTSAMLTLAAGYWAATMVGAATVRVPTADWWPEGVAKTDEDELLLKSESIDYDAALYTPQYWLFCALILGNATSGMALITSAKLIMTDVFSTTLPEVATAAFATSYVSALGFANAGGRLGWAVASDYLGSKGTYMIYGLGIPLVGSIPYLASEAISSGQEWPLYAFLGSTLGAVSFYGGLFSCLPPYIAATFGPQHMGAIHGRAVAAWAVAAVAGPMILATTRASAEADAIASLAAVAEPGLFEETFGVPMTEDGLAELVDAKTVTISRLLETCPPGTLDPTPHLYDSTCYVICGALSMALLANMAITPAVNKGREAAAVEAEFREKP